MNGSFHSVFRRLEKLLTPKNNVLFKKKISTNNVVSQGVFTTVGKNVLSKNAVFCAKNGVLDKEFVNTIINGGIYEKTC